MAEWFTKSENDAIYLIKGDHDRIEETFRKFEKAEERSPERQELARDAIRELQLHALMEEEIFYPTLRAQKKVDPVIMNEADLEHHVVKVLIAELLALRTNDERYDARFLVLAENVRHHFKEEEREMLPKARKMEVDFEELGRRMLARRGEALQEGIPRTSEDAMVATEDVNAPTIAQQKANMMGASGR